jgi:hypothetical protein
MNGSVLKHQDHRRQVAARKRPGRHEDRSHHSARAEGREEEAEPPRVLADALGGHERDEHLLRPHPDEHPHRRVEQRPQQPGGAHGERDGLTEVVEDGLRRRGFMAGRRVGLGLGAHEEQEDEGDRVRGRDDPHRVRRRDDGGDDDTRDGGARRLLQGGADGALEAVRREQLRRRQDAREDRAVRGIEEPGARAEDERCDRQVRDRHGP